MKIGPVWWYGMVGCVCVCVCVCVCGMVWRFSSVWCGVFFFGPLIPFGYILWHTSRQPYAYRVCLTLGISACSALHLPAKLFLCLWGFVLTLLCVMRTVYIYIFRQIHVRGYIFVKITRMLHPASKSNVLSGDYEASEKKNTKSSLFL